MRQSSPSALRNRGPIADVLARVLPTRAGASILEIASGSGEHVTFFAARFPSLTFQPSDPMEAARASVLAHCAELHLGNVLAPLDLDVCAPWPLERADAIVCINMIHASPPESGPALFSGAARLLAHGAPLVTYGPYRMGGAHTAPSNEAFDRWLKTERDPRWGVRDLEDLEAHAASAGLVLEERVPMPADNFTLIWRRV